MKLKAKDALHVSSVRADNIRPGEEFEISDAEGKSLVDRGLATVVAAPKKRAPGGNKKAAASSNKKAQAPRNKGA